MLNRVSIIARLGRKPELKHTANGIEYCFLNCAISSRRKQGDGSYAEHTDWVSVKAYRKTAENCAKYLDKGRQVYIEGKLSSYESTDDSGKKNYRLDVIADTVQFLGTASNSNSNYESPKQEVTAAPEATFTAADIPF